MSRSATLSWESIEARIGLQQVEPVGIALAAADLGVAGVDQDPIRPALELVRVRQLRQLTPDQDQRLLGGVLRSVVVAEDPLGDREQARADREGDLGKRPLCLLVGPAPPGWRSTWVPQCGPLGQARSAR